MNIIASNFEGAYLGRDTTTLVIVAGYIYDVVRDIIEVLVFVVYGL